MISQNVSSRRVKHNFWLLPCYRAVLEYYARRFQHGIFEELWVSVRLPQPQILEQWTVIGDDFTQAPELFALVIFAVGTWRWLPSGTFFRIIFQDRPCNLILNLPHKLPFVRQYVIVVKNFSYSRRIRYPFNFVQRIELFWWQKALFMYVNGFRGDDELLLVFAVPGEGSFSLLIEKRFPFLKLRLNLSPLRLTIEIRHRSVT
jgi:hypothetical protein